MTHDAPAGRARLFGRAAALFALALLVRASPWREVFGSGQVMLVGSDAFYHLRRIVFAVFRYPAFLDFDPYLHFPYGAKPIWTPLFDRTLAALLRPWVPPLDQGGQAAVEALVVWAPPLIGALAVVATWWLARRHAGERAGLVAGGALCLLSGHFWYSQLGFVDHHAAVALVATVLLAVSLELVAAHEKGLWARLAGLALLYGALAALCLLLWPGSLLHLALVELGRIGVLLSRPDARSARSLAAALAAGHALALLLVAPAGFASDWPQWGAMSPVVLSRFQPWLFATGAFVTGASALAWRVPALGATRPRRLLCFALLGVLALLASAVLAPDLRDGALDAWRWLAKAEAFQARVSESVPLLVNDGRFSIAVAVLRLSPFVFVLPVAALWLLHCQRGRPERVRTALIVLFALGLLAVTLLQKRFFNTAAVGVALVLGLCFAELSGRLAGPRARSRRALLWLGGVAILLPATTPYARPLRNEWRSLRGEQLEVTGMFGESRAELETASWLRTATPETSGWLEVDGRPAYAVLAPWPFGHVIEYVGRRPTVVDNFGDDLGEEGFAFAERFYQSSESEVAEEAFRRGVRYVVIQGGSSYLSRPPGPGSVAHSLFRLDGAGRPASDGPPIAPLERHRLRFESAGIRWTDRAAEPVYKVYELVVGAEIVGRAPAGAAIELRVGVFTNRGRRFFYEAHVVADADGTYRLHVPYANGDAGGTRVAPLYRLKCGDEVRGVAVSEEAVHGGQRVRGPALCLRRPRAAIDPRG